MAVRFVLDSDVLIDLFAGREPAGTFIPNLLEMDHEIGNSFEGIGRCGIIQPISDAEGARW